jgi:hypothetical protein
MNQGRKLWNKWIVLVMSHCRTIVVTNLASTPMDASWDSLDDARHTELDRRVGDIVSVQPENFERSADILLSALVRTSFEPYRDAYPPRILRKDLMNVTACAELLRSNEWLMNELGNAHRLGQYKPIREALLVPPRSSRCHRLSIQPNLCAGHRHNQENTKKSPLGRKRWLSGLSPQPCGYSDTDFPWFGFRPFGFKGGRHTGYTP